MKKNITYLISTCLAVAASAAMVCHAEETPVVGVLTSKTGHTAASEPAVQRAVEVLIKHHKVRPETQQIRHDLENPLGSHPLRSPSYIIGGPDMVPM
jgi:hypothetical protein